MASLSRTGVIVLALVLHNASIAGNTAVPFNDLTSTTARRTVDAKTIAELSAQCPTNYSLISQAVTPGRPESMVLLGQQPLLANGTAPIIDGVHAEATGVRVTAYNNFDATQTLDVQVLCGRFDAEYGGAVSVGVLNVVSKQVGRGVANCPAGYYVTGSGHHSTTVAKRGQYAYWKNGPPVEQRPDGPQAETADAVATDVVNTGTTDGAFRTYAFCRKVPPNALETHVATLDLEPAERRIFGFATLAAYALVASLFPGPEGLELGATAWRPVQDGGPVRGFGFTAPFDEYAVGAGGIAAVIVRDLRIAFAAKATSPVKLVTIIAPTQQPPPPVAIVQAIEYYNKARDHYFVTSIPQEISDLDTGVHPGWQRTGEMFNVYAAGSGGPLGRLPVCRYYGLPAAGLDSHFYTASVLECLDVGAKFASAWQIESGEVFQVHFPNIVTGECPAGTIAVLRTWNQRADSNHRYMTKLALRAQMLAEGHVSEGYGPNGVAFCAPA